MVNNLVIDLFKYNMVKTMTAGNKVLLLSVKKDTEMKRKILWLIGSKILKADCQKERKNVENEKFLLVEKIQVLHQLTLLHQQKRKKKAKRQRHHQPTSSSSWTASDSSTDEESHHHRFKIITENEKFKWKLPKTMANYANKYFEEYSWEDSLKETILCQNPVPDNLDNFEELDNFLRDILNEKRRINEQNIENVLEKLQRKTVDMMGSLSKLWNILEGAKGSEEDAVQISINDLLHYVEQTVLLLRQSSNAITYHRRLNVLGTVMNFQYQVKSMLKENASLLQKHDEYLFGKKFRNHIADTIKSKKQTKEILIKYKKLFSFSCSHAPRKCEGQKKVFLKKAGSKNSIMITNSNNSNVIPTTNRQWVSNRDMVLNPETWN